MRRDLTSILFLLIAAALGYLAPSMFEARSTAAPFLGTLLILAVFAAMTLWESRAREGSRLTGRVSSGGLLLLALFLVIASVVAIAIPRVGSSRGWVLALCAVAAAVVLYRILKWREASVLKAGLKTRIQIGAVILFLVVLVLTAFVPIHYAMLAVAAALAALILALFLNRGAA
ncbi:MAG: hypothetical protein WAK56_15720 [Candidatus Sulfotelmatobacter sp.]